VQGIEWGASETSYANSDIDEILKRNRDFDWTGVYVGQPAAANSAFDLTWALSVN
jgi:hypothetical protein